MELKADDTGAAIVPVLGCVLNQLCARNDHLPDNTTGLSKFHALRPPAISIKDYLLRIAKYAACSGECFVLALVYIDRIIQSNPTFVVNSLNIHRLLITSVMLAAKFFDDQYFNNAYYAKVGGVPRGEMDSLEVEFLFMTNFTLFVPTDQYRQYYTELCNHAKNSACECSTQNGKIPELKIPVPDAGTNAASIPFLEPPESPPIKHALASPPTVPVVIKAEITTSSATASSSSMMTDSPALGFSASRSGMDSEENPVDAVGPATMAF